MKKAVIGLACALVVSGCSTAATTASEPSPTPSGVATQSPAASQSTSPSAVPSRTTQPPTSAPHTSRPPAPARPHRTARPPRPASAGLPLPDRHLTPGAVFLAATAAQVCTPGWSSAHRDVTTSERHAVFAAYGIPYAQHSAYELDHLVPLEVGGDNSTTNLWPEPQTENDTSGPDKDALENHLHALVCSGRLPLRTAQQAIANNWVTAWDRYESVAASTPAPVRTPTADASTVVESYYAAINSRDYATAWRLGGDHFAASYAAFVQGFAGTDHDILQVVGVTGETVRVDLTAYQSDGSSQHFSGTYTVSGSTIVDASIQQTDSAPPSSTSAVRPGEFCATEGATAETSYGTLICAVASDGRDRWLHD